MTPLQALAIDYAAAHDIARSTAYLYLCICRSIERFGGPFESLDDVLAIANRYLATKSAENRFTAASHRRALAAMMRWAAETGRIERPVPLRPVKLVDHLPRAFTQDEFRRLLAAASPIETAAIWLAYDTGYRRGDLFRVRWHQVTVGPVPRIVHIPSKTGRREVRRLRPVTLDSLRKVRAAGNDDRLLPLDVGTTGWRLRWHRLGRRAGVDTLNRGLQAIRRTGATMAKIAGQSPAEYLGHSPHSRGVAERFYLDPTMLDDAPPLPPEI